MSLCRISAGQNEGSRFRHRELLVHSAVDLLQPNVCYVGGFTEGQKVAAMAQAFNIPIANGGGWPHHNMHLQAAMSNGRRVEFHYLMWKVGETIYKPSRTATGLGYPFGRAWARPGTELASPEGVPGTLGSCLALLRFFLSMATNRFAVGSVQPRMGLTSRKRADRLELLGLSSV